MITVIAGKQGAGKSLYAAALARKYMKNYKVYSNSPIVNALILHTKWYNYQYDKGTCIIIDEAQLDFNCRDYSVKEKSEAQKKLLRFLTLCRHYDLEIIFITQSLKRLDVQIRELATTIIRFSNTYKIPYFSFKDLKFKTLPILQRGRFFEDSVELEAYLNCAPGWQDMGQQFLRFVDFKALNSYDTHIIDEEYLRRAFAPEKEWNLLLKPQSEAMRSSTSETS